MTFIHTLILLATLWVSPQITTNNRGENFLITFDKGATWTCTVYQQQVVTDKMRSTFPDGRYTPRHCGNIDEDMTFYEDDWEFIDKGDPKKTDPDDRPAKWLVWAELAYFDLSTPDPNDTQVVRSNAVEVTR